MAIEYKLSYTASEIDRKLGVVDNKADKEYVDIQINNIETSLNEVKSDTVGEKTEQGGEIFNDYENNKALNIYSHTEGENNITSCLGFNILSTSFSTVTLNDGTEKENCLVLRLEGDANVLVQFTEGNKVSFRWNANFDLSCNILKIVEYNDTYTDVAIDNTPSSFNASEGEFGWVWIPSQPEIGIVQIGNAAHAEGLNTKAVQIAAHAEGLDTIAAGKYSHAEGNRTIAVYGAHAEGFNAQALAQVSHAEGRSTVTRGYTAHAEGFGSEADGLSSHAEGDDTKSIGMGSHAEGSDTISQGNFSHAEGLGTNAIGQESHAEGNHTIAQGSESHAEGNQTKAEGKCSHAENNFARASGEGSHAEGSYTLASGRFSHVEGDNSQALEKASHAEGYRCKAHAQYSHAAGCYSEATVEAQYAVGKCTARNDAAVFIVGNGNGTTDDKRKNAFEVYWDGHAEVQAMGETDKSVVIKSTLDAKIAEIVGQLQSIGIKREIVSILPNIEVADYNTIYMIDETNDEVIDNNYFNEYIIVEGKWELIGSTKVNMSNYYTKEEIDAPKSHMVLKDSITDKIYAISIANGKLVMEEQVTEEDE